MHPIGDLERVDQMTKEHDLTTERFAQVCRQARLWGHKGLGRAEVLGQILQLLEPHF